MAAPALVADYDAKLAALRASVPNRLKEIDGVLARHFGASLDEVANKARSSPAANPELALSLSVVRETLMATAADLELGTTWLKLHVPKIQDGGNYGVAIQHEVIKHLEGQIKELHTALDGLPDYFSQRGGAAEKVLARTSTDEKSTKTTSKSVGGKDGSEEKESTTTVQETAKKLADPLFDQVEAVVAIDLKYFIMLKRHAELARATYLTAFDLLEKNMEILEKPRGSKGESSHLSMF